MLYYTYFGGVLVAVETKNELFSESIEVLILSLSLRDHLVKILDHGRMVLFCQQC